MKRFIAYLYNRYCKPTPIDSLFLGGIQRDFGRMLTEGEAKERNAVIYNFLQTEWFNQVLNEELKEYSEGLFNICETQDQRDYVASAIKVLLKFEATFKSKGVQPEDKVKFDKFKL